MPPDDAVEEFANTFREWHYLTAGAAVGFAAGVFVTARWKLTD